MAGITIIISISEYSDISLERCLNSLNSSSFLNFEVFLVESTLSSFKTASKYNFNILKKDKRFLIKSYSKVNLLSAMIKAIQDSQYDYLMFMNPEDYLAEDYLSKMMFLALKKKASIIRSDFFLIEENSLLIPVSSKRANLFSDLKDKEQSWLNLYLKPVQLLNFELTLYASLYSKDLVLNLIFSFKEESFLFFEFYFPLFCIYNSEDIYILNEPLYFHSIKQETFSFCEKEKVSLNPFISLIEQLKVENLKKYNLFSQEIYRGLFKFIHRHQECFLKDWQEEDHLALKKFYLKAQKDGFLDSNLDQEDLSFYKRVVNSESFSKLKAGNLKRQISLFKKIVKEIFYPLLFPFLIGFFVIKLSLNLILIKKKR